MKKVHFCKLLPLVAYCIPYCFLCLYADAMYSTMIFYAVMIVCFALLYHFSIKTRNLPILFVGNALSFLASSTAAKLTNLKIMDYYFKPFTAYFLMVTLSLFALLLQILFILSDRKKYAGS